MISIIDNGIKNNFIIHYDVCNRDIRIYLNKILNGFGAERVTKSVWKLINAPYIKNELSLYFKGIVGKYGKIEVEKIAA